MRERSKDGAPQRILLDFDSTDDPVHGDQEGGYYHGFYEERILYPLVVFDGETDQLITAVLRPGNTYASRGALAVLKRIVKRLRQEWPAAEIEIRADAGFAVPAIYEYCEEEGIDYTIGLVSNPRLQALAEPYSSEPCENPRSERERRCAWLPMACTERAAGIGCDECSTKRRCCRRARIPVSWSQAGPTNLPRSSTTGT